MTPIQVIGIGLEGAVGLAAPLRQLIAQAAILAGSDRHLSYFPDLAVERWGLAGLERRLQAHLAQPQPGLVVVLTSGDPLFFGLGRQLLQHLPAAALTFHPHVSAIQLAFSRAKLPWQGATLVSVHGRSLTQLAPAVKRGEPLIAILTDGHNTPAAIARFLESLALPTTYQAWVGENLGSADEQVRQFSLAAMAALETVAPLNVVILQRVEQAPELAALPVLGIPDGAFVSFSDRPGLMTKREVRVQVLAELALQPHQVIWDIGAGTGSVSVEIARLVPTAHIWAIEQTTAGEALIRQNVQRFGVASNVTVVRGPAPEILADLPAPHRIFVGGSGGHLSGILEACVRRLLPAGRLVAALATLESCGEVTQWLQQREDWQGSYQQLSVARSAAIGSLTRWTPLNPVVLAVLTRCPQGDR